MTSQRHVQAATHQRVHEPRSVRHDGLGGGEDVDLAVRVQSLPAVTQRAVHADPRHAVPAAAHDVTQAHS